MPVNELEQHPFLDYHQSIPEAARPAYEGLIIGSFPIYAITDSLDENLNVVQKRFDAGAAHLKFFYGSKISSFWQYVSAALGEPINPAIPQAGDNDDSARQRCIELLRQHKLLMTDTLYRTNRNGTGSEDPDLWQADGAPSWVVRQLKLNTALPELLGRYPTIKNLYFTATGLTGKSPFGWFREISGRRLRTSNEVNYERRCWSIRCTIDGKEYKAFLLPTPKERGVHFGDQRRTLQFVNYLRTGFPEFYDEIAPLRQGDRKPNQEQILSRHRTEFLVECYRQALVSQNCDFDGIVPEA